MVRLRYCPPKINTSLVTVFDGEIPIKQRKIFKNLNYAKKRFKKLELVMNKKLEVITMQSLSSSDFSETEVEIVELVKKKITKVKSKSEKLAILTT